MPNKNLPASKKTSSNPIKVVVAGAAGRMGQETVKVILNTKGIELIDTVGNSDSELIGKDIGEIIGIQETGIKLSANLKESIQRHKPDVLVDSTVPNSVFDNSVLALQNGVHSIIGATGLTKDDLSELEKKANYSSCAVLVAPNFAIGALLLIEASKMIAKYFDSVEIIELHHDKKVDAPSGTAIKTAQELAKIRKFNHVELSPNSSARGQLTENIRIHSLRLPGLIAHEEIIFGGIGQTLTLRHDTLDRSAFMPGVILAIQKVVHQKGLIYGLENLLDF